MQCTHNRYKYVHDQDATNKHTKRLQMPRPLNWFTNNTIRQTAPWIPVFEGKTIQLTSVEMNIAVQEWECQK